MIQNSPCWPAPIANRDRLKFAEPRPAAQRAFLPLCVQSRSPSALARALVVMLIGLVHCLGPIQVAAAADRAETPERSTAASTKRHNLKRIPHEDLPIPVQEMRDAILIAVASGDIEELRTAIEWNELPPEFGAPGNTDPIEYFRKVSKDGAGREILAILGDILSQPPAQLPIGPDHENNSVFVWPYLSELPPGSLTPPQQVDLYRLMPFAEAAELIKRGKWTWYRLAIAADGTWHIFSKSTQ